MIFFSQQKGRLLGLVTLLAIVACDKDVDCEETPAILKTIGSAYIQCETGPFFISYADMSLCSTNQVIDSLMSDSWNTSCSMSDLMTDSALADIKVTYLVDGVLIIEVLTEDVIIENHELQLSGESIDTNVYPFYGAVRYQVDGKSYMMLMLNRYIGGCFHDELIWEIVQ